MRDRVPRVEELEPVERGSVEELRAVQLRRLQWSVRHAALNVPFYRDLGPISELRDLADLPFTGKADLREHYPYGMFAVPPERVARIHASSGTTGRPTVVGSTAHDLRVWSALMARSIRAAGGRPGDRVHVAYGYGLFTGGLGAHYGAERLGCTVIPVSGGMTARQVTLIDDLRPDVIMVTPSYLLALVDEMRARGLDPRASSLQVAILGAEPWTDALRTEIEQALDLHAVDIYGLSEIMGPGVAVECVESKDGAHLWEDHFYPEIIDPRTGEVLPDGTLGELVLTTLSREAMPMIRYRTRDLTRLLPGTARPMRRIERVTGRTDDLMIVRGVNVFPAQIEEQILRVPGLAAHFQCRLTRPHRLDTLTVRAERRPHVAPETGDELAARLTTLVKEHVGVSVTVEVLAPGGVERSAGKMRRVIDDR